MKIDTICDVLLKALAEVGYHENTIFNYKVVIRRFKTFCDENSVDTYTPAFGKIYAEDVLSKKTGQFSINRIPFAVFDSLHLSAWGLYCA